MFIKKLSSLVTSFGFCLPTKVTRLTLKYEKEKYKKEILTYKKKNPQQVQKTKKKHVAREFCCKILN